MTLPGGGDRRGHIDNSLLPWIVLILVAVGGAHLYRIRTGEPVTALWARVSDPWRAFVIRTLVLGAVAAAATVLAGALGRRKPVKVVRRGEAVVIRLRGPGLRAAGLSLALLAVHSLQFAWAGGGLARWLVAAVSAALGLVGLAVALHTERIVVEPGRVAFEKGVVGAPVPGPEHTWEGTTPPAVRVERHGTGGAFGQPLIDHYRLLVGSTMLHEGRSPELAGALASAVDEALGRGAAAATTKG